MSVLSGPMLASLSTRQESSPGPLGQSERGQWGHPAPGGYGALGCPIRPSPASHSLSAQFGDTAGVTPRWVTRVSFSLPCLCHGRHLNSKDEGGRLGGRSRGAARCLCSGSPIPGLLPLSSLPVRVGDPSLLLQTGNERLSMHKGQESPCLSLLRFLEGQAGRGRRHLFLLLPWGWGAP